jgi:hypothetical protein
MKLLKFTRPVRVALLVGVAVPVAVASILPLLPVLGWATFGHGPLHDGVSTNPAQSIAQIKWQTPVDLNPQYSGNLLLAHYGAPLCTARNTIVLPVKVGASDTFKVEGRRGSDGVLQWTQSSDYSLPSHNWVPSYQPTLLPGNEVMMAAAGGTVYKRTNADVAAGTTTRLAFYGIATYNASQSTFNSRVKINTGITSDLFGNVYFGFQVSGTNPAGLVSGIARISKSGVGTWTSAVIAAQGDSSISKVPINCTPALSFDQSVLYIAVRDSNSHGYLLGLNSTTLAPLYRVRLKDPHNNNDARVPDDGTETPCVGPDGDVYYGVLESPSGSNHYRGWMLHYNATLSQTKTPGAFGWDHTPSIVDSKLVASYTGTSPYLLMTKYNDYASGGGIGLNKVAIIDPRDTQSDYVTGATVMKEIMTKLGPTPDPPNGPQAVREWCINAAAVDPFTKCGLVNCEDGKLYRWDFTTDTFTESIVLTPGLGEAYTPTIVGADGKVYAINNATLFACGQ